MNPAGHSSRLAEDSRGVIHVEYLALAAGIAIGLIAIAVALRDTYAEGFVARSLALLGVQ